jgi:hypothetical protein
VGVCVGLGVCMSKYLVYFVVGAWVYALCTGVLRGVIYMMKLELLDGPDDLVRSLKQSRVCVCVCLFGCTCLGGEAAGR